MIADTIAINFSEVHHLAWLNWEKDGCPRGLDMEYWLAAESLVVARKCRVADRSRLPGHGKADRKKIQNTRPVQVAITVGAQRDAEKTQRPAQLSNRTGMEAL